MPSKNHTDSPEAAPVGARRFLTGLFGFAGVMHFVKPQPFDSIVPPQLPGDARTYTYASGVAELACATGLALPRTRKLAGLASAALLLAVWPANIYMCVQAFRQGQSPARKALTLARIPLQLPMIRWGLRIWRNSRD